jgi:hypothetical protein
MFRLSRQWQKRYRGERCRKPASVGGATSKLNGLSHLPWSGILHILLCVCLSPLASEMLTSLGHVLSLGLSMGLDSLTLWFQLVHLPKQCVLTVWENTILLQCKFPSEHLRCSWETSYSPLVRRPPSQILWGLMGNRVGKPHRDRLCFVWWTIKEALHWDPSSHSKLRCSGSHPSSLGVLSIQVPPPQPQTSIWNHEFRAPMVCLVLPKSSP